MDWKQLAPGLAIGGIALFAIAKLAKGGGSTSPSVYNALVPTSQYTPESRDAARVSAFSTVASVGLAQIGADAQKSETASAIELAKARFANQLTALGSQIWHAEEMARINNAGLLNRLTAEITDRQYDRELQTRAIDQTFALAQGGQLGQQAGSILQSILNALGRGQQQQQQQRPGGSSGGSSGGGMPQSAPQRQQSASQLEAARRIVGEWITRNFPNQNFVSVTDWGNNPLGYVQGIDLSPWDWLSGYGESGFDYWEGFGFPEPVGSVSSSFSFGGVSDWWSPLGFDSFDQWYNEEYGY